MEAITLAKICGVALVGATITMAVKIAKPKSNYFMIPATMSMAATMLVGANASRRENERAVKEYHNRADYQL